MRRTYISSDFTTQPVPGTKGTLEFKNYFGSKMLIIDDSVVVDNGIISWNENLNNEQINPIQEISIKSSTYNPSTDKLSSHTIILDPTQSDFSKNKYTQWILNINIENLLVNNIFAKLKYYRTFNGVANDTTLKNSVNLSIVDYIRNNIVNRYKFKSITLYLRYYNLVDNNLLRYQNVWDPLVRLPENIENKIQPIFLNDTTISAKFGQSQDSTLFAFNYYFDLTWERI